MPDDLQGIQEVSRLQTWPMMVLALLCVFFGVFYQVPLGRLVYPALGIREGGEILSGTWDSVLATSLMIVGLGVGLVILLSGSLGRKIRIVPTWSGGEIQANEQMIIPGTHFYKTVSSLGGARQLYAGQEKGYFDLYSQSARVGLAFSGVLRWFHTGVLPVYLTWVMLGLLIVLFVICGMW